MADDKKETAADQQAKSGAQREKPPSATSDAAPASPQHPGGAVAKVKTESKPLKIGEMSGPDEEKESTLPKGATVGGQDAEVPEPGNKIDWPEVHDPYAKIEAEPFEKGVHEGFEKFGAVPLPVGHPQNEPGAIPRSPGEWPTGGHSPENPLGRSVPGTSRPAGEPLDVANVKREQARIIHAEADKKGVSPLHPDIDHAAAERQAQEKVGQQTVVTTKK